MNLQQLYPQQAEPAYCDGKYQYLESGGQIVKICISMVLKNQNGKKQEIKTIWELGKKGHIRRITPYSGHHYEGE